MININNILPKDNELTDFEKMIMKWTAFDHYCPSIKAEVIWDMMLSEFIVDMVAYSYNQINNTNYSKSAFYLLAKEFPIKSEKAKNSPFSSSKIDYLVAFEANKEEEDNNKKVILVELKTTPGSFNKEQLNLYRKCNAERMFEFYDKLIHKKVISKLYNKKGELMKVNDPLAWVGTEKYIGQITYMFHQFSRFHNTEGDMKELSECINQNKKTQFHLSFIQKLHDRYKTVELYYLYVERVRDNKYTDYYLSVQMVKDQNPDDKEVSSEHKEDDNKNVIIYDSKNKTPKEFLDIMKEKNIPEESNAGINKLAAWETFCKLIDAVDHYKEDFEETKRKYEPYNKYKAN